MAPMIAVTGHHVAMCCPFCDRELLDGDPACCFNPDCFLFGWPAPIPIERMLPNARDRRRTMSTGPG